MPKAELFFSFRMGTLKADRAHDENLKGLAGKQHVELYHTFQFRSLPLLGDATESKLVHYAYSGVGAANANAQLADSRTVPKLKQGESEEFDDEGKAQNNYGVFAEVGLPLANLETGEIRRFVLDTHWWEQDRGDNTKQVKRQFTQGSLVAEALRRTGDGISLEDLDLEEDEAKTLIGLIGSTDAFEALIGAVFSLGKRAATTARKNPDDFIATTALYLSIGKDNSGFKWAVHRRGADPAFIPATAGYDWQAAKYTVIGSDQRNKFTGTYDFSVQLARMA